MRYTAVDLWYSLQETKISNCGGTEITELASERGCTVRFMDERYCIDNVL